MVHSSGEHSPEFLAKALRILIDQEFHQLFIGVHGVLLHQLPFIQDNTLQNHRVFLILIEQLVI